MDWDILDKIKIGDWLVIDDGVVVDSGLFGGFHECPNKNNACKNSKCRGYLIIDKLHVCASANGKCLITDHKKRLEFISKHEMML